MHNKDRKPFTTHSVLDTGFDKSRRRFLKYTGASSVLAASSHSLASSSSLLENRVAMGRSLLPSTIRFNGERKDPVTGMYLLGNGYRAYSPSMARFNAPDSASPFGPGGINSYAYCLGDPVNKTDPSGHFALMTLLIGAIVGAVVGATVSIVSEGIQTAVNPDHDFDWKQVGIGAALGFISGGFGAAAQGAKTSVQIGLAVADTVTSSAAEFGLNVATGMPVKQAGISAGIGAVVGLGGFGVGHGISRIPKGNRGSRFAFPTGNAPQIPKHGDVEQISLGQNFLLFKKKNTASDRLVLTSHGSVAPSRSFVTDTKLNYYAPHGKALVDPGLGSLMNNNYRPYEAIQAGGKSKKYLLSPFNSDFGSIPYSVQYTGVDVVAVRPGRVTTNAQLLKSLKKAGLHYTEIDMVHCRCHTPFGGGFDALPRTAP
ncbi:RHS repeat-associated core domain-containing protein [Vibrio jasicida]|uniref:RHS repeat-associated core domain-containing protein n=1 Tax=Vibrio jasicida TaxID=766224 RepID=A0ABW7J6I5_9VIBR